MDIPLERIYDSATITCVEKCITYIRVIVRTPNVLAADVFGTGISR
jgi:hypothetical protein